MTPMVRALTDGCTRRGAYERLYSDVEPRRARWARRCRCGDMSRRGGVILCEDHPNCCGILLPFSWLKKAS